MLIKNIVTLTEILQSLAANGATEVFDNIVHSCVKSLNSDGKIIFAGNGGSAADCQHLAAEFTGRFVLDRKPLPALALTTDTSALTAIGNDYGIDHIFVRQLIALAGRNDTFIAISTSGNSENILRCLNWCIENKIRSVLLSGKDGGKAKSLADINLIGHSLLEAIEEKLNIG